MDQSEDGNGIMNEEQLLEFCQRLGLAENGYLDESQLNIICRCIGFSIGEEAIKDLFEELDVNHDGRVSIANLCCMLKSMGNGGNSGSSSNQSSPEKKGKKSRSGSGSTDHHHHHVAFHPNNFYRLGHGNHSPGSNGSSSNGTARKDDGYHGCFSMLDPVGSGVTKLESLLDYWLSIGMSHEIGFEVLSHFGIEASFGADVDLNDIERCIDEEVYNNKNILPWVQAALCMYRSEIQFLKTSVENACQERDKLQSVNEELSKQSQILAQEVDEQNTKIELNNKMLVENLMHKYDEQISQIKAEFLKEKSAMVESMRDYEETISAFKADETKTKQETLRLQSENKSLETEIERLADCILLLKSNASQLENEISTFRTIQKNLEDMELKSMENNRRQEEKLNMVQIEVQMLRDTNDELSSQLESIRQEFKTFRQSQSLLNSLYTNRTEDEGGGGDDTSPLPSLMSDNFNLQAQALQLTNGIENDNVLDANIDLHYKTKPAESRTQNTQTEDLELAIGVGTNLQSKLDNLTREKADLQKQISELESNLTLLAEEYEKTEDYWATKLADERAAYEFEKQVNDDKLVEIQEKIKEYEELLCESIKVGPKLDPVTEFYSFENQMAELETENHEVRALVEKYEEEMDELSTNLEERNKEFVNLKGEVSALSQKCIEYEQRIATIVSNNDQERADSKLMEIESKKREEELLKRIIELEDQLRNNNNEDSNNHKTFLIDNTYKSVKSMPPFNTALNPARSNNPFLDPSSHPRIKFTHVDVSHLTQLKQKCKQYEEQCWSLSQTVLDKEKYTDQLLAEMRYQHEAAIQNYESLVETNQQIIDSQIAQLQKQEDVIKNLIARNNAIAYPVTK